MYKTPDKVRYGSWIGDENGGKSRRREQRIKAYHTIPVNQTSKILRSSTERVSFGKGFAIPGLKPSKISTNILKTIKICIFGSILTFLSKCSFPPSRQTSRLTDVRGQPSARAVLSLPCPPARPYNQKRPTHVDPPADPLSTLPFKLMGTRPLPRPSAVGGGGGGRVGVGVAVHAGED